jgi:hypothetical protein
MNRTRLYSYRDLMQRLTHKDWAVAAIGKDFFFVTRSYLPGRKI